MTSLLLTNEKPVIVIEWGARHVRVGFAGEAAPRATLPSPLGALAEPGGARLGLEAWRGAADSFVADLFSNELLARPERHVVLMAEDALAPRSLREALTKAVLSCKPKALAFAPGLGAAAVAAGAPTAVVPRPSGDFWP